MPSESEIRKKAMGESIRRGWTVQNRNGLGA